MTKACKYCLESGGKMVRPCSCNDYVHRKCLQQWYESKGIKHEGLKSGKETTPSDPNICEICRTEYARGEVFNCRKFLWDITNRWIFNGFLILLNLFVFVGFAGYDKVGKYANKVKNDDSSDDSDDATSFEKFIMAMLIVGIFLFLIKNFVYILVTTDHLKYSFRKAIIISILIDMALQIIPVAIFSGITGELFWNVTTYSMGITVVTGIILIIMIIYVIWQFICMCCSPFGSSISNIIKGIRESYSTTEFVNSSHV